MNLSRDIYSIDNKKIYSRGEEIDDNLIAKMEKAVDRTTIEFRKLKSTFLIYDFKKVFKNPYYKIIFEPQEMNLKILNVVENTVLKERVIQELQNIKDKFNYTYKHIINVTCLILKIALFFNLEEYNFEVTTHVGLTHDLGKSRISQKILYNTEKLSSEEWRLIQTHPTISYLLLLYYPIKYKSECLGASFEHHEKLDGSGYPRGVKNLSNYTELIAPADILDALLSSRPYRKTPYSLRAALDCLQEEAEQNKINKKMVYYLIALSRKDKPQVKDMEIGKKWRDSPPEDNFYGIRG